VKRILLLFLAILLSAGCLDRIHEPGITSAFEYSVNVEGLKSGGVNFKGSLNSGDLLWEMVGDSQYEEISVYKEGKLLYTYSQDELEKLRSENLHKVIIWKLSEEGIELISEKEAYKIHRQLKEM